MSSLLDRLTGDFSDPMNAGPAPEKPGVVNVDRVPLGRPGLLMHRTRQLQGSSAPLPTQRSTFLSTAVGDNTWSDEPVVDRFD